MALFRKKNYLSPDGYIDELLGWHEDEIVLVRGKDCTVLYRNNAAAKSTDESVTSPSCMHTYAHRFKDLCAHCPCPDGGDSIVEFEATDLSGGIFSVKAKEIRYFDDSPATMLVLRNITETRKSEEHLYSLAYIDQLTNIPNRRKFTEDFDAVVASLSSGRFVACVAMFDLDNFKAINDTYGHNTGDIMLSRLAENITSMPEYKERLYRIGGDEFIILLTDDAERFSSPDETKNHYVKQLSELLQTYTVPNIDLSCTLSMGIAVAPIDGDNTSELLRKADIALYESKGAGRNRTTVFSDIYDKSKKLKDLYIGIQPVLNAAGKTFGYELIEKSDGSDDESINLSTFNRTLDALNFEDMSSGLKYFINYTDQLLSPAVLKNIPADKFIILLAASPQPNNQDIKKIKALRENNYLVALTGANSSTLKSELLRMISFCKFDKHDSNIKAQARIISSSLNVTFICDSVNTQADFQRAKSVGYKLFQGYFFTDTPPASKSTKELDPISANYFRLLKLTSTNDYVDFREISDIISADLALSFKLLQMLNSAAVGLRNVTSISMAVAYLGEENLKQWIGLLALRGLGDSKPIELVRMSLIRARFGELLAPHLKQHKASKHLFLLGMLSLLHIAMEMTREKLLQEIPVGEEIRDSLLSKNGPYSDILKFFESFEYANWDEVARFAGKYNIDSKTINDCYIDAIKWYKDLINS